jgi:hypothetical protein
MPYIIDSKGTIRQRQRIDIICLEQGRGIKRSLATFQITHLPSFQEGFDGRA